MPPRGGIPSAPKPAAKPPPMLSGGNLRGGPATVAPPAPYRAGGNPGSDIQSSGAGYGSKQASAYKQTPAYHQALTAVYDHQSPAQKAAIVKGAIARPSAEGNVILAHIKATNPFNELGNHSLSEKAISSGSPLDSVGNFLGKNLGSAVGSLGNDLRTLEKIGGTHSALQNLENRIGGGTSGEQILKDAAGGASKLIGMLPTHVGPSNSLGNIQQESTGIGPAQFGVNAAKDAVNLPAEALPSMAIPVGEALSNHWGQALNTIVAPFKAAIANPQAAFEQHPLNTALMASGLVDPLSAIGEAGIRGVLGKGAVDRKTEPVQLTAQLTRERPDRSFAPLKRAQQKSIDAQLYRRDAQGKLVPKTESTHGRLVKLELGRLVGQAERVRRADHAQEITAHAQAVVRGHGARTAQALKSTFESNPSPALVHGHSVLSLIGEGLVRRPETTIPDLIKIRDEAASHTQELAGQPADLKLNQRFIADINKALKDKAFVRDPRAAFKAAEQIAKDYKPLQAQAKGFGHYGLMSDEALQRREVQNAAAFHMPGVRRDPELGTIRDIPAAVAEHARLTARMQATERLAARAGTRGEQEAALRAYNALGQRRKALQLTEQVPTAEMAAFMRRETGGRETVFVSHAVRNRDKTDSAHYTSQEVRPRPARTGETGYAISRGLTDPTHEALLQQRVKLRGIVGAHRAMNRLIEHTVIKQPNGNWWTSHEGAKRDAESLIGPDGKSHYSPFRVSQPFHPHDALEQALEGTSLNTAQDEATKRSLDINERLQPSSEPGEYGLIHDSAKGALLAHQNAISPSAFFRGFRGLNNQFRQVVLATSFRHLPGVAQETAIRMASSGIGPVSLLAGRAALKGARELDPVVGRERTIQLKGGGTASGQVLQQQTRQVASHYQNTLLHEPLTKWANLMSKPGPRQLNAAWKGWVHFTLTGTKKILEEQALTAGIGKQVINDFGGRHGILSAAMGNWGKMIDQAAHGLLDEQTARNFGANLRRVYGRWTDLTPGEQSALMFSPFGMWWTNSVSFLARFPTDHPIGAAIQAGLNTGTEKERQKLGLDMFSPNHLPLYLQGAAPLSGGGLLESNYYSPPGVANDPGATAQSLIAPWLSPILFALGGRDWLMKGISSPTNKRGDHPAPVGDIATVLLNSLASSFVPLYQKAQQIAQGGASSYDTSTFFNPQPKQGNPGPAAGLLKAVTPFKLGHAAPSTASSSGSGYWGGGSSSSSSSGSGGSGYWDSGGSSSGGSSSGSGYWGG